MFPTEVGRGPTRGEERRAQRREKRDEIIKKTHAHVGMQASPGHDDQEKREERGEKREGT